MTGKIRFAAASAALGAFLVTVEIQAEVKVELLTGYSFAPGSALNENSYSAYVSPNGRYLALSSEANNLVPGFIDLNGFRDAVVLDRQTGVYDYVSVAAGTTDQAPPRGGQAVAVSDDGRYALFSSWPQALVTGVIYANTIDRHLFLFDRVDRVTRLVSHVPGQPLQASSGASTAARMSADGRFVLFESRGANMVPGGTSNVNRVFLYDRQDGETRLLSHVPGSPGTPATGSSTAADLSPDGSLILLNTGGNVYLYHRVSGAMELISHFPNRPATPAGGAALDMTPDGRFVLLESYDADLVNGVTDGNGPNLRDVFVYDRQTQLTALVSASATVAGRTGNGSSEPHRISDDGGTIYFVSTATNLVAPFTDGNTQLRPDVYRFDRQSGVVSLVSHAAADASHGANGPLEAAESMQTMSPDGRYLVYATQATNLEAGVTDTNAADDLYLFDRDTQQSTLVSRRGGTLEAQTAWTETALVLPDGVVLFSSLPPLDPAAADPQPQIDVFAFESATGEVSLETRTGLSGISTWPSSSIAEGLLSPNGRYAAAASYLWDGLTGGYEVMGHAAGMPGIPADREATISALSPDGRFVGLVSNATNLVAGVTDSNNQHDAFFYDRNVDTAFLLSHVSGDPSRAGTAVGFAWVSVSAMTPDARHFFFTSKASDLVAGQTGTTSSNNLFYYNRPTSTAELVSHSFEAVTASGVPASSTFRAVSADQRHVIFSSAAHDLIPGFVDHNDYLIDAVTGSLPAAVEQPEGILIHAHDLYYYDRALRQATLISHLPGLPSEGALGAEPIFARLSADTSAVFYTTEEIDQFGSRNPKTYRWDRAGNTNELVTQMGGGPLAPCNDHASLKDMAIDGRLLLITSRCAFVAGDTNGSDDAYLVDRARGLFVLISHQPGAAGIAAGGSGADLSADGGRVAFTAPGGELYTYDRATSQATRLTSVYFDRELPAPASVVAASDDGNRLLVTTESPLLVPFDANFGADLFLLTRGDLFADGFESGSASAWSQTLPSAP